MCKWHEKLKNDSLTQTKRNEIICDLPTWCFRSLVKTAYKLYLNMLVKNSNRRRAGVGWRKNGRLSSPVFLFFHFQLFAFVQNSNLGVTHKQKHSRRHFSVTAATELCHHHTPTRVLQSTPRATTILHSYRMSTQVGMTIVEHSIPPPYWLLLIQMVLLPKLYPGGLFWPCRDI